MAKQKNTRYLGTWVALLRTGQKTFKKALFQNRPEDLVSTVQGRAGLMFKFFFGGKKTRARVLALLLSALIVGLDLRDAHAFEAVTPVLSTARLSAAGKPGPDLVPELALRVPSDLGRTIHAFQGSQPYSVILLQDAHVHEEAQLHLAQLLKFLSGSYGLKIVNVEGAEGALLTHALSYFPDKPAFKKAAGYFLKNGRLTGSEYAAMILDPGLRLFGAEEKSLYEQNREIYFKTLEFRERDAEILSELKRLFHQLGRYIYPETLQEVVRLEDGAFQDSRRLEAYLDVLISKARLFDIAAEKFGTVQKFLSVAALEKTLQFEAAREELTALENELKKKFPGEVWDTVNGKETVGAKEWRRRDWSKIRVKVKEAGLDSVYPEAVKLIEYFEGSRALGLDLTKEIRALTVLVKEKLLLTEKEKKMALFSEVIRVYEAFLELGLTPEDADFYFENRRMFKTGEIRGFLEPLLEQYQFETALPEDFEKLDTDLPELEKFYQAALTRDEVLVNRTLERMKKEGMKASVLVAGGFHTAGIERKLREKGISYLTVMPLMTSVGDEIEGRRMYEEALSEKPLNIEEIYKAAVEISGRKQLADTRFQVVPWLMSANPLAAGEVPEASKIRPLLWLAVVNLLFDARNPEAALERVRRTASSIPNDEYRDEILSIVGELEGGVMERRSESMQVYWRLLPGGLFSPLARSSGKDSKQIQTAFGQRKSAPIAVIGEDEVLSSMSVEGYLVPEKIRKAFELNKESRMAAVVDSGAENSVRSELRSTESPDEFRRDVETQQARWLEETLAKMNRMFTEAENYVEKTPSVEPAKLSRYLEQSVAPILRELEDLRDTDFYREADAAVSLRFRQRWSELMSRIAVKSPSAVADLKSILPQWNPDAVVGASAPREENLETLLGGYRTQADFFQTHSLEGIQKALDDFSRAAPAAARESRYPGTLRFIGGVLLFYVLPGVSAVLLQGMDVNLLLRVLAFVFAMRAGYLALTLTHEWTHLSAAMVTGTGKEAFTWRNITASLSPAEWIAGLFAPLARTPRVMIPKLRFEKSPSAHAMVRDAAWMFSGLVTLTAGVFLFAYIPGVDGMLLRYILTGVVTGFVISFFIGFWSDVVKRKPQGIYCCGNYGAAYVDTSAAQSSVQDLTSVRKRVVKSKRGQLPSAIRDGYDAAVRRRGLFSWLRNPFAPLETPKTPEWFNEFLAKMAKVTVIRGEQAGGEIGYIGSGSSRHVRLQGHSRYGTSSAPAVKETQPHTWLPERRVPVWIADAASAGPLKLSPRVSSFVTHNGDFDAWELYGASVSFDQVAVWLENVLGVGHSAKGDTPKLAGVVDYVYAQGMWDAALRFGFFETVPDSLDAAAPPPSLWKSWGAKADETLARLIREGVLSPVKEWNLMSAEDRARVREALVQTLSGTEEFKKYVPEAKRAAFIEGAVTAFLDHDLYTTAKIVKKRSEGSFGVILTSSLQPEKTVLFAHSQPLFVGYEPELNFVTWASEAAALKVSFTANGRKRTLPYRFDMNQETGEILEIRMEDGLAAEGESAQSVRVYSELLKRELTADEIARSGRMIDTRDNPLIDPLPEFDEKDLVGSDIRDIPSVLRKIQQTWQDPNSFNRQSAQALLGMLIEKDIEKRIRSGVSQKFLNGLAEAIRERASVLKEDLLAGRITGEGLTDILQAEAVIFNERAAASPQYPVGQDDFFPEGQGVADILLTGFEVSQWFGEQFVSDLSRLFPALVIEAASSNKVLNSLKEARFQGESREFRIQENNRVIRVNKNTIVFSVSQSGQTFPTLNATIALRAVLGDRVFAVTGGLDTLMGRAVGQVYAKGTPFSARIFDNMSGLRPAEPSTVATSSLQATFTEILLYLGTEMKGIYGPRKPLGMAFEEEDLVTLRQLRDELNSQGFPAITGTSPRNPAEKVDSPVRRGLLELGRRWAQHIIEPAIVIGIGVLIVGVFSYFGLPFFPSSWGFLQPVFPSNLLGGLASMTGWPIPELIGTVLDSVLFVAANGIFAIILFPWLVTLGLRVLQSRYPLLARTGKRTLVIGDIPYVHQTLEAFVSKIFSLSYGFASLDVHAGNPRDHYLPRFGHRIVRGLLSLLMEPDSRLRSQQDAVSGVRMTRSQQEGVRNLKVGAEVFTLTRSWEGRSLKEKEVGLPVPSTPVRVSVPDFIKRLSLVVALDAAAKKSLTERLNNFGELYRGKALHIAGHELGIELGLEGEPLAAFEEEFLRYGERQQLLESFYEKRFDSFERLVSAYVLFWEIGRRVSRAFRFLRLTYDMAASQSRTRVATTRSPVADVNLNLIFSQLGRPDTASQFSNPPVPVPFRVETSESIQEKSARVIREEWAETSVPAARVEPASTLSSTERRRLYQRGIEMALEKIAVELFNQLKSLEDGSLEPSAAAHLDRNYSRVRKDLVEDLQWFEGKIDPTRLEELRYLFRQAVTSSRDRSARLRAAQPSPSTPTAVRTPQAQPSETFQRLRSVQARLKEKEQISRQIAKTFLSVTQEKPEARSELRSAEEVTSGLNPEQLREALTYKSRLAWMSEEERLLPGLAKAEAAGIDLEKAFGSFTEEPEVMTALGISRSSQTGTRGYYLFEYREAEDFETLKALFSRKTPGVVIAIFSRADQRGNLAREFSSEILNGDAELPEMPLLTYLTGKYRELQVARHEVIHFKPLEHVKLKKDYQEALQLGVLPLAAGGIVIRSDAEIPGARELRAADVIAQVLKAALLVSKSA